MTHKQTSNTHNSKKPQRSERQALHAQQNPPLPTPAPKPSTELAVGHVSPKITSLEARVMQLQRQHGNLYVQKLIQRASNPKEIPTAIGYMGLNPEAYKEAEALKKSANDQTIISLDNPEAQKGFDTKQECMLFVYKKLGISPLRRNQFDLALACLEKCDKNFREQMADMMTMFREAELGKYKLERLVLSGHHSDGLMWGDENDQHSPGTFLPREDLTNLAKAFPDAANQVEDIMFSACNTKEQVELCKQIFPNLKSVWVYAGYSPTVKQNSASHITKWEKKTRGQALPTLKDKMGNSAVWTKEKGFLQKLK